MSSSSSLTRRGRRAAAVIVLWAAGLSATERGLGADPAAGSGPPTVEERVEVILVEVVVRATDKKGRPITDVQPEDVKVLEGKEERKLAYLEPLSAQGSSPVSQSAPAPSTLYDQSGRPVETNQAVVMQAAPHRRVVLVFDVANSKTRVRASWKAAALEWVRSSMKPDDQVGIVVFATTPVWLLLPTHDRNLVLATLEPLDLEGRASDRSRRRDMSELVDEILMCAESSEMGRRQDSSSGAESGVTSVSDEASCAYRIAEPYVRQWATESSETVSNLRTLTGQLAAVEGRKEVLLFSEGIIPDAAAVAVHAMVGVFGANRIPLQRFTYDLRDDSLQGLSALHAAARAAGVLYFTFDTRSGADRGYFDTLPYSRPKGTQTLGINPWVEMYEETSGTLGVLAEQTGGRSYYGTGELSQHVADAAASFYGIYTLGYYRPSAAVDPGKLRIRIARKGVKLKYPTRASPPVDTRPARLDLSIRRPEPSGRGDRQWLTVVLEMRVSRLPLRKEGGVYGCQLGAFVQAVRPDGTVADEVFQDAVVALPRADRETVELTEPFRQALRLELPPGPYRLSARLSDDRQGIVGRRSVDITLEEGGSVRAGIGPAGPGAEHEEAGPDAESPRP